MLATGRGHTYVLRICIDNLIYELILVAIDVRICGFRNDTLKQYLPAK